MRKAFVSMAGSVAVLCFAGLLAAADPVPEPPKKVRDQWEYSELQYRDGAAKKYAKWVGPGGRVSAFDWESLAAKLKAPAAQKGDLEMDHRLRTMNHLGSEGWELITYRFVNTQISEVWTFKRKVSKEKAGR